MNRKDFLKGIGLVGLGSMLPPGSAAAITKKAGADNTKAFAGCVLIPRETAGPYPLNLSGDPDMFRRDIREEQTGALTTMRFRIVDVNTCNPVPNARFDLWHCNKDGYYSGFTTTGQQGQINYVGATWLRGIQMTDANGEVSFITIFPGWYNGRATHVHFQVFLSSVLSTTSQMAFPRELRDQIHTTHPLYSPYGADPVSFANDNVFRDGTTYQMATMTENSDGSYETFFEIGINGDGATGLMNMEPETGGQFSLGQNFPNPYSGETSIPFTLGSPSDVRLELYDLAGKKLAEVSKAGMDAGEQKLRLNMKILGLPDASYVYQIHVKNKNGSYTQCKMMTAKK